MDPFGDPLSTIKGRKNCSVHSYKKEEALNGSTAASSSKRSQLFVRSHNERLSVITMRVSNPDRSPV
jgi:hypothetical protein